MSLRLPSAFFIALGVHGALGAWLSSARIVPEQPMAMEAPQTMEIDLTAPAAEPPPLLETPPAPAEETPPPPEPEPEPAPKIVPKPTAAPKPPTAKTTERQDKPRPTAPAAPARPAAPAGPSTGPVCISKPDPTYPAALEERGIGGSVTVLLSIDAAGRVTDATVAKSSGQPALDRSALTGVRRWRFKPALRQGQAIAATTRINVVFRAP